MVFIDPTYPDLNWIVFIFLLINSTIMNEFYKYWYWLCLHCASICLNLSTVCDCLKKRADFLDHSHYCDTQSFVLMKPLECNVIPNSNLAILKSIQMFWIRVLTKFSCFLYPCSTISRIFRSNLLIFMVRAVLVPVKTLANDGFC